MTAMRNFSPKKAGLQCDFQSSPARPTNTALQLNVDHIWFGAFLKRSQLVSDLSHLLPLLLLLDQVGVHDAEAFTNRCCSGVGLVLAVQGDLYQLIR